MHACKSDLDRPKRKISSFLKKLDRPHPSRHALRLSSILVLTLALTIVIGPRLRAQSKERPPRSHACGTTGQLPSNTFASRFALGFKTSTLGLGPDAGFRLACRFNLRAGFNTFNYSRQLSSDGVAYDSAFRMRSVQALVDWFPFSRSFHFSGGLLVYNGNHMTANALIPENQILDAGDESVISNPANPITGKARSGFRRVAPQVAFGFGNFIPRTRNVGFSVDLGVVFQGAPQSHFMFSGSACDPSGEFCADVANDPNVQAQALVEKQTIEKDLFFLKYYPFVSVEIGYRF